MNFMAASSVVGVFDPEGVGFVHAQRPCQAHPNAASRQNLAHQVPPHRGELQCNGSAGDRAVVVGVCDPGGVGFVHAQYPCHAHPNAAWRQNAAHQVPPHRGELQRNRSAWSSAVVVGVCDPGGVGFVHAQRPCQAHPNAALRQNAAHQVPPHRGELQRRPR